jgi:hypothetical protein
MGNREAVSVADLDGATTFTGVAVSY